MSSVKLVCVTFLAYVIVAYSLSPDDKISAYEVLEQYEFPVGLLPKGVKGYHLNTETGEFWTYLNGSCSFSIKSYKLEYESVIRGVISHGRLSDLEGVRVKLLIVWVNVVKVTRRANHLQFSVGIASAEFPVESFAVSPECGCGFNCDLASY